MLVPIPPALVWTIAPIRTIAQDDDLKPLGLTEQQKTLFASLAQSGFKRQAVELRAKPQESYVTLLSPRSEGKLFTYKLFVYVSESRTALQREIEVEENKDEAEKRYKPLVSKSFPLVATGYFSTHDPLAQLFGTEGATVVLRLSSPEQTATPLWLASALEELEKASKLVSSPPKDSPQPATPQSQPTDPIGKTVQEAKLVFDDIGNFYKLKYTFTDNNRAQFVFARKAVWDYNSLKVQELYSTFYESETAPSAELLQKVFQKSFTIGGVVLEAPSEGQKLWRMRYRIDAPTDLSTSTLKTYLQLIAGTADALEKELGPEDKL